MPVSSPMVDQRIGHTFGVLIRIIESAQDKDIKHQKQKMIQQ
jgi:hypothetical protein